MSGSFSLPSTLAALAFASLRLVPLLWMVVGLQSGRFPGIVAHAIFVASMPVLLAPLWGTVMPPLEGSPGTWLGQGTAELAYGILLAIAVALPLYAVRWAGALADALAVGKDVKAGPLARFYAGLALALFAAGGGLRLLSELWTDTLLIHPPGSLSAALIAAPLQTLGSLVSGAFSWMVTLSGPLLLGGALILVVTALSVRAMRGFGQWLSGLSAGRAWLVVGFCLLGLAGLGQALPGRVIGRIHEIRSGMTP